MATIAILFLNNGPNGTVANMTCGVRCLQVLGVFKSAEEGGSAAETTATATVRDLWSHKDIGTVTEGGSLTVEVDGYGASRMLKISVASL